jgi:uncharacterized protein DUF3892
MATYRVDFVRRDRAGTRSGHVEGIGGVCGGGPWRLPVDEAIAGIERRQWSFYVESAAGRVDVVVAQTERGEKYLTTTGDGNGSTLLALPDAPFAEDGPLAEGGR